MERLLFVLLTTMYDNLNLTSFRKIKKYCKSNEIYISDYHIKKLLKEIKTNEYMISLKNTKCIICENT